MPPPPTWVYLRTHRVLPHPTWLSLWESWRRSRLRGPLRAYSISGKTLSTQCAHWAPPPEGEARRPVAAVNGGPVTLVVDPHLRGSPDSLQLNNLDKRDVSFVGRGHAPAANVSFPLHRPSSTVPKPSPSGEGGPAKPGRMRGGSVKAITSAKNPTFPPHIRQRSKIFASFSPGGILFYANFSAYKKSGGLPKFGNPPDFLIDKAPSAWQTGAGCAGFCPG